MLARDADDLRAAVDQGQVVGAAVGVSEHLLEVGLASALVTSGAFVGRGAVATGMVEVVVRAITVATFLLGTSALAAAIAAMRGRRTWRFDQHDLVGQFHRHAVGAEPPAGNHTPGATAVLTTFSSRRVLSGTGMSTVVLACTWPACRAANTGWAPMPAAAASGSQPPAEVAIVAELVTTGVSPSTGWWQRRFDAG